MKNILVYGEINQNGELSEVVYQLVTQARTLKEQLDNAIINVIVLGEGINLEKYKNNLEKYGVNELVILDKPELKDYNTKNYASAILNYLRSVPTEIFLIGATTQGRDLAPQISSALSAGLTADCTGLEINEDGKLAATRPTFGGELMATILSKTLPQMATVRPNVFSAIEIEKRSDIAVNYYDFDITEPSKKKVIKRIAKTIDEDGLETAKIILAGGKGLKDKETFYKLNKLAEILGAKVGATRKAVDAGLAPQSIQIGQTGKTVSPELYIAFGISGAVQHCIGIERAKKIIAVNNDKNAPITKIADTTIIADAVALIDDWLSVV